MGPEQELQCVFVSATQINRLLLEDLQPKTGGTPPTRARTAQRGVGVKLPLVRTFSLHVEPPTAARLSSPRPALSPGSQEHTRTPPPPRRTTQGKTLWYCLVCTFI